MRRLWMTLTLFLVYVLGLWAVGFWVTVTYMDNIGLIYFTSSIWVIASVGSGLVLFSGRTR